MLLQKGDKSPYVVTIEAAGFTVSGTATQIAEHVRKSWDLGQQAVHMVREQLGPALADELVPLVGGGVLIHKIQSSVHDTCVAANLVPSLVLELRENQREVALWRAGVGRFTFGREAMVRLPVRKPFKEPETRSMEP